jgi:hypothetical protein
MKYHSRGFLNSEEGLAAYEASVRTSDEWNKDGIVDYIDAGITLSDCSRKIYLEFDTCTKEQLEQRKQKVATLLKVVQEFHDKFLESAAVVVFNEEPRSEEF